MKKKKLRSWEWFGGDDKLGFVHRSLLINQGYPDDHFRVLVNLMPSGKYLMEDFFYAGELQVVLKELGNLLHLEVITVNGKTLVENNSNANCYNHDVIATLKKPLKPNAGIAVLKGNLCENGAVIKPSAATPKLMRHCDRAVVFENIEDYHARVDDPDHINETCIIVLKGIGPVCRKWVMWIFQKN